MHLFRQLGWLCLLAVAGGGPLPLYFHHSVCHTRLGHAEHSHPHHADGSACSHVLGFAKPVQRTPYGAVSAPDSHEDCATCYLLSQVTHAHDLEHSLVSQPANCDALVASDRLLPAGEVPAYAPRGPPVC